MNKFSHLIKLFIFYMFIILSPTVYAAEFNMNSYTSASLNGTRNRYRSTEIYNTGTSATYTFGTRYNGRISDIETYFSYPFEENTTYRLTYNMSTEDFRNKFGSSYWWDCSRSMDNSNSHVVTPVYISYKKVQLSFKPTANTTCIRVWLRSSNLSTTAITGVSNWNLSSITLYDPAWQSGSGSGQGSTTPTPTPTSDYSSIINNQNNNTENIINNNNENTQDIINNNNENTNKIIENENANNFTCATGRTLKLTPMIESSFISSDTDTIAQNPNFNVSNYIYIKGGQSYTLDFKNISGMEWGYFCFYNNDELISCTVYRNLPQYGILPFSITSPDNANRLKLTYRKDSGAEISGYICTNKSDDTTDAINNLNDTMKDDSVPYIEVDFDVASDTPISDLILMPINLIDKIQTSLNYTCQPYTLPFDFFGGNNTLTLPCINLSDYLGSNVYNILDYILCFYIAYQIGLMCISIYDSITSLNDGFGSLYTPKHHDTSTRVGQGEMEGRY